VDFRIRPEPSPDERDAIELALRRLIERPELPPQYTSPWRRAGIAETVGAQAADARPRTSFGATRA
jgi:hypothetical protein